MTLLWVRLRKWHRDVGFLSVGLLVVYAISGIAVNHREDWDYNHAETVRSVPLSLSPDLAESELAHVLAERFQRPQPKNAFWRGPERFSLFFGERNEVTIDWFPGEGRATETVKSERPGLRQANFLHLNEAHGLWTWVADLFAVALLFLALSGPVIARSPRTGWRGRGKYLVLAGVLIPVAGWLLLG